MENFNNQINTFKLLSLLQKNEKNKEITNKIFQDHNSIEIIEEILSKKHRSENDTYIIKSYLKTLTKFIDILSKDENNDMDLLLSKISNDLKLEISKKNNFLMKIGEIGKNFYVILSGKVGVLVPKHYDVIMTKNDYLTHLKILLNYEENYLLNNTLLENYNILPISFEEIQNKQCEIYKPEEINLKQYFYYINGEKFQNENKINSLIGLNQYEIDGVLNPKKDNINPNQKLYYLKILGLFKVVELNQGNSFGEIALINEDSKRTASIFIIEDSIFGTLNSKQYHLSIKYCQDIIKTNHFSLILETKLFQGVGKNFFINKFWNFFVERSLNKGDYIFRNNFERDEIYFIYKGEVKLVVPKLTYKKIHNFINELSKNRIYYEKNIEINKEAEIILSYIKKGKIIGMKDLLFNKKFFCDGIIESQKAIIFAINYKFMNHFFKDYDNVKENWKEIESKRINIMINRLLSIKRSYETDIFEKIKRDKLLEQYDNGQKVTNFFENMGNVKNPGEGNTFKLRITQNNFNLNLSGKNILKKKIKNGLKFRNSDITIKYLNKSHNNNIIKSGKKIIEDYYSTQSNYDKNLLPKIENSKSKEKTEDKTTINKYITEIDNNEISKFFENDYIEKKCFKTRNDRLHCKNINLHFFTFEQTKNQNSFTNFNSKDYLKRISQSKNQISHLDIKEQNSKNLDKLLYFYDEKFENVVKKNLGLTFRKTLSLNKNKKKENKKKYKPPFLYVKMGKFLQFNNK